LASDRQDCRCPVLRCHAPTALPQGGPVEMCLGAAQVSDTRPHPGRPARPPVSPVRAVPRRPLPLPPDQTAQPPPDPAIQLLHPAPLQTQPEVTRLPERRIQRLDRVGDRPTTAFTHDLAHPAHQSLDAFRGDPDVRLPKPHSYPVTPEVACSWPSNRTLNLVHAQPQRSLEIGPDAAHNWLLCALASDVNIAVVRIAAKRWTSASQPTTQIAQQDTLGW